MAELGLFGLPFPEEFGGSGSDALTFCLVIEELGRVDQSVGITLSAAVGLGAGMIDRFGTQEQKERWLVPACRGELLASFALTEPNAGSDAAALRTTATSDGGDGWVIEGSKAFIDEQRDADHRCPRRGGRDGAGRGRARDLDPARSGGCPGGRGGARRTASSAGARATRTSCRSADCRVPQDALLGERGGGFAQCLASLTGGRISMAALSVGLAQACLDHSVAYAKERESFGRPDRRGFQRSPARSRTCGSGGVGPPR